MYKLCDYGCGLEALFIISNGKNCCSKHYNSCPAIKEKNSKGLQKAYSSGKRISGHENYLNISEEKKENMQWSKNKTSGTDERIKKHAETLRNRYKNKELTPGFLGKKHTKETKQKISNSRSENNNGYIKTKYYPIFSPFMNRTINVQGTWEFKYATYLNENNINWIRTRTVNLKYKLSENDYVHTYYPDFYLTDTDEYIEVKGFWWKSKDGRVDDKRKMDKVLACNPDKIIKIFLKNDLIKLGIEL